MSSNGGPALLPSFRHQTGVTVAEPRRDPVAQLSRQYSHRGGVSVGYRTSPLLPRDIPLLVKGLEGVDELGVGPDGFAE